MLKPFYIKKKNIDNRLVPEVSAADAGKVLGVTEDGTIAPVEAGGGGSTIYLSAIEMEVSGFCTVRFNMLTSSPLTVGTMTGANFKNLLATLGYSSINYPVNAFQVLNPAGYAAKIFFIEGIRPLLNDVEFAGSYINLYADGTANYDTLTDIPIDRISVLSSTSLE